jgi:predicted hydrocarbon binding protein
MKRKDFIARSWMIALAAGGFSCPAKGAGRRQTQTAMEREAEMKKFREQWVATLMANLESQLDAKTRTALMESCGRACARRSSVFSVAASGKGDAAKLIQALAKILGKDNVVLEGGVVRLTYPKCYCEMVADGPERLPDAYCCCSQGWIKEMFETAAGKPVGVKTLQTIKRGADSCKFVIKI